MIKTTKIACIKSSWGRTSSLWRTRSSRV